jgi:zinc transporter ZupT
MTAASFWSLLEPAFKIANEQNYINQHLNFFLIICGFLLGALFVYITDLLLPSITSNHVFQFLSNKKSEEFKVKNSPETITTLKINSAVRSRLKRNQDSKNNKKLHVPIGDSPMEEMKEFKGNTNEQTKWNRLLLLIIAVTVHNFPG